MAWQTPKTDWKPGDSYNLTPDYARQTGNIEALYEEAKPVAGIWPMQPMAAFTTSDLPYPDKLNAVEYNYDTLARRIWPTGPFPPRKVLVEEGPQWDDADFNRIEGVTLQARPMIEKSIATRPQLSFPLGTEYFIPWY